MRARTAAIWVGLAAMLGAATVVWRPAGRSVGTAPAERLVFDPAAVAGIELESPSGTVRVERVEAGLGWSWAVVWTDPAAGTLRWPARDERVRAALALLATTPFAPREGGDNPTPADRTRVSLLARDGGVLARLSASGPLLGGRRAAAIEATATAAQADTPVWAEERLLEAWTQEGLRAWRDPRLLFLDAREPARLALASGPNAVEMSRGRGRWAVVSPAPVDADPGAAAALLAQLRRVAAVRFDDTTPAAETGLAAPAARITAAAPEGPVGVAFEQTAIVGTQADALGREVFVGATLRLGATVFGPVTARVETDRLGGIAVTGEAYARRTPLGAATADLAGLSLTPAGAEVPAVIASRDIGGWTARGRATAAGLVALATALAEEPASAVRLVGEDAPAAATLAATGLAGEPLSTLELLPGPDGLTVRDALSGVAWVYTDARGAALSDEVRTLLDRDG